MKDIRQSFKTKIYSSFQQFFDWKSVVALIPIIFSFYPYSSKQSFKNYIGTNLTSFTDNKNIKFPIEIYKYKKLFFYDSLVQKNLKNEINTEKNKYQFDMLLDVLLFNKTFVFDNSTLPLKIGSFLNNTKEKDQTNKTIFQLRTLKQLNFSQKKTNRTILQKKLSIANLQNLDSFSLYYFLKKQNIKLKYTLQSIEDKEKSLILNSGNFYWNLFFQNSFMKSFDSTIAFPSGAKKNKDETFPLLKQSIQDFFFTSKPKIIEKTILTKTPKVEIKSSSKNLNYVLKLNEENNDIIFQNPKLLSKIIYLIISENELQDSSFDFFGGTIKKRKKFISLPPFLNVNENVYIQDLKYTYSPNTKISKDWEFLKASSKEENSKNSTIIRELKNRFGDQLFYSTRQYSKPTTKTIVEISVDSNSIKEFNTKFFTNYDPKLTISIDIPFYWDCFTNDNTKKNIINFLDINKKFITNEKEKIFFLTNQNLLPFSNQELINDFYQYYPNLFKSSDTSNIIVKNKEYLRELFFISFTQISICFYLFYLLRKVYKSYQYELGFYLLEFASRLNLYDEDIKSIINEVYENGNIRIFRKFNVSFLALGGMIELLPKFSETVWFLKNQCRPSKNGALIPKAILLVGPPGTGKTLLVKTIGAEAKVPVLIQSGNTILEDSEGISKLQEAFQKAREMAPCVLFIDEMDTIGSKRIELELTNIQEQSVVKNQLKLKFEDLETTVLKNKKNENVFSNPINSGQQVNALTQLLVELDGIEKRQGFVVFGATNRRETLDPALIRPGRFNEVIEIGLPDLKKRIEILKIYTKKLGFVEKIDWNTYGKLTLNYSAADLATIVNRSAIQSILNNQKHSNVSLYKALKNQKSDDLSFSINKLNKTLNKKNSLSDQFFHLNPWVLQMTYYEIGHSLFKQKLIDFLNSQNKTNFNQLTPENVNLSLEKRLDQRSETSFANVFFYFLDDLTKTTNKIDLYRSLKYSNQENIINEIKNNIETFKPNSADLFFSIIILLAGKASEFLFLYSISKEDSNLSLKKDPTSLQKDYPNTFGNIQGKFAFESQPISSLEEATESSSQTMESENPLTSSMETVDELSVQKTKEFSKENLENSTQEIPKIDQDKNDFCFDVRIQQILQNSKRVTTIGDLDLYKANLLGDIYVKILKLNNIDIWEDNSAFSSKTQTKNLNLNSSFEMKKEQLLNFENKQIWNTKSLWLNVLGNSFQNLENKKWSRLHLSNPENTIFNEEIIFSDLFKTLQQNSKVKIENQIELKSLLKNSTDVSLQNILYLAFSYTFLFLEDSRNELDFEVYNFLKKEKFL